MNFAELAFYAEAEGLLPTRVGKINALIKKVKAYPFSTIEKDDFDAVAASVGIDPSSLSAREWRYIENAIK